MVQPELDFHGQGSWPDLAEAFSVLFEIHSLFEKEKIKKNRLSGLTEESLQDAKSKVIHYLIIFWL